MSVSSGQLLFSVPALAVVPQEGQENSGVPHSANSGKNE